MRRKTFYTQHQAKPYLAPRRKAFWEAIGKSMERDWVVIPLCMVVPAAVGAAIAVIGTIITG